MEQESWLKIHDQQTRTKEKKIQETRTGPTKTGKHRLRDDGWDTRDLRSIDKKQETQSGKHRLRNKDKFDKKREN